MGECSNRWLRKSDESKLQGLRVLGDDVKSVTVMNIGYGFGDNSHGGELDPRASQGSRKKKKVSQIRNTQEQQNSGCGRLISFLENIDFKEV